MKTVFMCVAVALGLSVAQALAAEETCCQDQAECSSCCARSCGWVAGVEATFLRPTIQNGNIGFSGVGFDYASENLAKFDDFQGAPRIWLGFEGEQGWGVRARYWDFCSATNATDLEIGTPPFFFDARMAQANLQLDANTFDLEITRHVRRNCWDILFSGGVRYAYREIADSLYVHDRIQNLTSFTSLREKSGGTGLTGAIEGARRLGDSNFSLVGNIRGSAVWGDNVSSYVGISSDSTANTYQSFRGYAPSTTFIVEGQLGIRWERRIECLCANVFTQLVGEYQYWTSDGCAAYDFSQTVSGNSVFGHSLGRDVEFAGVSWAIGFKR